MAFYGLYTACILYQGLALRSAQQLKKFSVLHSIFKQCLFQIIWGTTHLILVLEHALNVNGASLGLFKHKKLRIWGTAHLNFANS
eukprot:scaffold86469_cov18-Tisochrysis_lutea.AAC.4